MNEMEPAESFSLNLRGYQKQALLYVFLYLVQSFRLIRIKLDALIRNRLIGCSGGHIDGPSLESVSIQEYF